MRFASPDGSGQSALPPPVVPLGGHLGVIPGTVRLERRTLSLEFLSAGRLVPWLGPAVRGITALRHRTAVCSQPREEWAGRWSHCRGCPHLPNCGYGICFEPASPAGRDQPSTTDETTATIDAVRPVVIAPEFPAPVEASAGMSLRVRITSIGTDPSARVPAIINALEQAGRRDGLGPDRVRFSLRESNPPADVLVVDPARLPPLVPGGSTTTRLTIRLDSPLFMRERTRQSGDRHMIVDPGFDAFLRHSVRIIREFFPSAGAGSDPGHEQPASRVTAVAGDIRPFRQEKASRRTFRRFQLEGIVGWRTFADVPVQFLPWLALAGVLHVGGHRVAGAGGWTVHTDPAR